MPSRVLNVLNLSLSRGCMHTWTLFVPHIINSPEYFVFKVATIQWINNRLDTVSGSSLLLVNFEISALVQYFPFCTLQRI